MILLQTLADYTNRLLQIDQFQDYCPNGVQVEGKAQIERLVSGVTASRALLEAAVAHRADAVLVHHGYFWKGEKPTVTGMKKERLKILLATEISLLVYHLPLDAHAQYGNNAQLALRLQLRVDGTFADVGMIGGLHQPMPAADFAIAIEQALGRKPLHIDGRKKLIETIAWCSGGAQNYIENAAALGVDAYLTGEVSEQTVHIARETGMHFFAAGHHATERYGAQALGEHLAQQFQLEHRFIDIDNPV